MKSCTFLGHGNTSEDVKPLIKQVIVNLIEKEDVNNFYVGNHGNFDRWVYWVLKELSQEYNNINYAVVLAYLSNKKEDVIYKKTIYPEGIELTPKKFAISFRNKWMINNSDIVVAYVSHSYGGAAQFLKYAKNHNKKIINIAELC